MSKQLFFYLILFFIGVDSIAQSVKVSGIMSRQYDSSSTIVLKSGDTVSFTSLRVKKNSSFNRLLFENEKQSIQVELISNKTAVGFSGDTLAEWKGSILQFYKSNDYFEIIKLKKNNALDLRGWVFLSETDTIASLTYELNQSKNEYTLIGTYMTKNIQSIIALQMAIGRIDKNLNMEYTSDGFETFFSILVGGLLAN